MQSWTIMRTILLSSYSKRKLCFQSSQFDSPHSQYGYEKREVCSKKHLYLVIFPFLLSELCHNYIILVMEAYLLPRNSTKNRLRIRKTHFFTLRWKKSGLCAEWWHHHQKRMRNYPIALIIWRFWFFILVTWWVMCKFGLCFLHFKFFVWFCFLF